MNIAIIGLGNISNRHRKNIRKIAPNAKIHAVSSSGRLIETKPENTDFVYSCIEKLNNIDIKLAIVASPANLHLKHSEYFIKRGVPVIIEKPIAHNAQEAEKILNLEKKYGTRITIGYCLRYLESLKEFKFFLEDDKVGKILHIDIEVGQNLPSWREGKDYRKTVTAQKKLGGGVLLELSHEIDYAEWLFGPLELVYSHIRKTDTYGIDVEDYAFLVFKNHEGIPVTIKLDLLQKKVTRNCKVVGEEGTLEIDILKNKITHKSEKDTVILFNKINLNKNDMYIKMIRAFMEEKNKPSNVESSFKLVKLIDEIKADA